MLRIFLLIKINFRTQKRTIPKTRKPTVFDKLGRTLKSFLELLITLTSFIGGVPLHVNIELRSPFSSTTICCGSVDRSEERPRLVIAEQACHDLAPGPRMTARMTAQNVMPRKRSGRDVPPHTVVRYTAVQAPHSEHFEDAEDPQSDHLTSPQISSCWSMTGLRATARSMPTA